MKRPDDLCALGAALLPTRDLLRILLRRRVDDDDLDHAVAAWSLTGPAQKEALRGLRGGPELLAAVELGRRAWMHPMAGRRVRGPDDVAAVVRPRASEREAWFVLALDERLSLARVEEVERLSPAALRVPLALACRRVVVAVRRFRPAVPSTSELRDVTRVCAAARTVDIDVVDAIVLGDDGHASFVHLGLLPGADRRWK